MSNDDRCFCGAEWVDVWEECAAGHGFGEADMYRVRAKKAEARVAELEAALADERDRAASCCVYIAEMMLECGAGDYPRGSRLRQAARMILEGVDKRRPKRESDSVRHDTEEKKT